jgi:hypothetical protein
MNQSPILLLNHHPNGKSLGNLEHAKMLPSERKFKFEGVPEALQWFHA